MRKPETARIRNEYIRCSLKDEESTVPTIRTERRDTARVIVMCLNFKGPSRIPSTLAKMSALATARCVVYARRSHDDAISCWFSPMCLRVAGLFPLVVQRAGELPTGARQAGHGGSDGYPIPSASSRYDSSSSSRSKSTSENVVY
jgi:hypothetical protein